MDEGAQQHGQRSCRLLMIDVDHFKLLQRQPMAIPRATPVLDQGSARPLAGIAAEHHPGFAGRYGGEEFCLLRAATPNATRAL